MVIVTVIVIVVVSVAVIVILQHLGCCSSGSSDCHVSAQQKDGSARSQWVTGSCLAWHHIPMSLCLQFHAKQQQRMERSYPYRATAALDLRCGSEGVHSHGAALHMLVSTSVPSFSAS